MADDYSIPPVNIYSTPGSAVANTLQQLIARRAMEKRQDLLDQVNLQHQKATLENMQANTASLVEQRAAQAEERKARTEILQDQANQKRLATFMPGQELDPTSANWMQTNFPQSVKQEGGGDISQLGPEAQGPMPPAKQVFSGSPDYQMNQRLATLIGSEDFNKLEPMQKLLMIRSMSTDPKFADTAEKLMTARNWNQPKRMMVYDPVTNKSQMIDVPAGTEFHMESRPPVGPQPVYISTTTVDGNTRPVFASGGQIFTPGPGGQRLPVTGDIEAKPSAGKTTDIPPADEKAIADARTAYENARGGLSGTISGFFGTPGKSALATYNQRLMGGIGKMTKDQSIMTAARELLNDPSSYDAASADLADLAVQEKRIPPEKRDEFANILARTRGK